VESFRTEIENPVVAKDIIDLEQKILPLKTTTLMKKNLEVFVWQGVYMVSVSKEFRWCELKFLMGNYHPNSC
jgi:hypothetical protein